MTLLAPLGLIALAACVLPVLIHLIRRSEQKRLDFAALRWLAERSRPRERLYWHDPLLLALRLLLIATLALLLAVPVRYPQGTSGSAWVLVSPAIDVAAARAAIDAPLAEWHWLAPGFPMLDAPAPAETPLASLIREADALLPPATKLSFVVPQQIEALDAARLRLSHAVDWHALQAPLTKTRIDSSPPELRIAIRGSAQQDQERTVIHALAKAWQSSGRTVSIDDSAESSGSIPASTSLLFWLDGTPDDAARQWIANGGRALASSLTPSQGVVVMTTEDGQPLLRDASIGRGHLFSTAVALTPRTLPSLLDPAFPQRLLIQLEPGVSPPSSAAASAIIPQQIKPAPRGPYESLNRWIALFAVLLFLIERLRATRPRGATA